MLLNPLVDTLYISTDISENKLISYLSKTPRSYHKLNLPFREVRDDEQVDDDAGVLDED